VNDDDKTQPAEPVASLAPTHRMARTAAEVAGYELGELLGRGGMGEVIAAHDPRIEREVALKRMRGDAPTADAVARFIREAKIQARLDHPAIVPVHELGRDDDGLPYFTMKRLSGTTLHARLAAAAGAPNQPLLRAFADVCFAVELAHSRGVVHRDLKPSNIMLGDYGEVYVLDWGVARVIGSQVAQPTNLPLDTGIPDGTATGALLGTPGYMAPEQMRGEQVEPAADVYALGAILFEILAGEPLHPLGNAAIASTLQGGVECSPSKRAPARNIAPELDAACLAALAEEPARRPTARVLATRVQASLDGDRDLDRRRALAAESLAEARSREAAGDRVQAIRAAGRAVALDPESRDAAELATALILTPPRETPPGALAEVAAVEAKIERARGTRGAVAYLAAWLLLPFAAFVRVASWPTLLALVIGGTAMSGVVMLHARGKIPSIVLIVCNVAFGVLFERVGGPFLFTPLYACIIAIGVGTQVRRERRGVGLVALAVTLATPIVLELTGVLPRTFRMTPDGLLTNGTVYDGRATMDFVGMLIGSFALCALLVTYTLTMNRARKAAQREAALQAWHLRQLLPPT
jgi:eukaryotic-like serine/threonine-protein kinase